MSVTGNLGRIDPRGVLRRVGTRIGAGAKLLVRAPRGGIRQPDYRAIAIRAGIALAVFLVVAALFDASAIRGARLLPEWLNEVFDFLTDFGKSSWFLWPLAAILLLVALAPPSLPRMARLTLGAVAARAAFLFLAIGLPSLFGTIAKRLIGRARPFVGGDADPWLYHPLGWKVEYSSLPSGHATTAFAAAVAIGLLWPRLRPLMWIYAIVIALSRVVLTAHHPSDVLAGLFLGGIGVLLVRNYFASRRLVFGIEPDGRIEAFPGPSWRRVKSVARALLAD